MPVPSADDDFFEYGSEWKIRGDIYEEGQLIDWLTRSKRHAIVLNRDRHHFEAWADGRCLYRGDQTSANKALGAYENDVSRRNS